MFNKLTELRNKMEKIEGIVIDASDSDFEERITSFIEEDDIALLSEDYPYDDMDLSLDEAFSYIKDLDDRQVFIDFVECGREYYQNPTLDLEGVLRLYNREMSKRGAKKAETIGMIDYFEQDEVISWIAASVFDDCWFGSAVSEDELEYREGLREEYKEEIELAKVIVSNNPNFEAMTYKDKINFVANLIVELSKKRQDKEDNMKLE